MDSYNKDDSMEQNSCDHLMDVHKEIEYRSHYCSTSRCSNIGDNVSDRMTDTSEISDAHDELSQSDDQTEIDDSADTVDTKNGNANNHTLVTSAISNTLTQTSMLPAISVSSSTVVGLNTAIVIVKRDYSNLKTNSLCNPIKIGLPQINVTPNGNQFLSKMYTIFNDLPMEPITVYSVSKNNISGSPMASIISKTKRIFISDENGDWITLTEHH